MARTRKGLLVFLVCMLLLPFGTSHGADALDVQKEIRILHVNDFHGYAVEYKAFGSDEVLGGIAYLAWRADALRKEKPGLLLAAGDMIQGNNWANLFQGKPVVKVMNEMRFDAMVVGNHEFDFGQAVLRQRIGEARFPVLGANVEGMKDLKPYALKEVEGVRIAVIGIVTEDAPVTTHPRNVVGLKFLPIVSTVKRYVKELRQKADVIIVLSHAGLNMDMLLAERVKGIDVIVGGHTHTKLANYMPIGKTIIVQAWEHGLALGVLDLTIRRGEIVHAESHLEEIKPATMKTLPSVLSIVEKYKTKADGIMEDTIGKTEVDLDGKNVRLKETNFGDFVADVMREKAGADVAIINGGGIRTSIAKGKISVGDIYSALPFDNYVVAVKLTGSRIMSALEHGVSGVENEEGQFPQVSGLSFSYSPKAPKGARVRDVRIGGRPMEQDQHYTVATNDFLAAGGDGYKAFGDAVKASKDFSVVGGAMKGENLVYSDSGKWIRDVVIEYIRAKKKVSPAVEGRIEELN